MTCEPQLWLPKGAIAPDRVQPAIEQLVSEWARTWFAQARPSVRAAFQDDWPSNARGGWRSAAGAVCVELAPGAQAAIAGAMLGTNVPPSLQEAERTVVEALARAAADDLASRLARCAGLALGEGELSSELAEGDGLGWWSIALGAGKRSFKLALSSAAMAGICRQSLPRARRPRTVRLKQAVASQQVRVSASVGRCALSLADLGGLAVGDVLVLDRDIEATLDLHVNGRPSTLSASLEARDGRAALILA